MKKKVFLGLTILSLAFLIQGCSSAVYATYEKFGVYKRDLLKKRVIAARDEQKEAGEQFKDALARMREMYGGTGSNLEKTYDKLKSEYEDSVSKADAVRKRVRDMETVAADLFKEWETEIQQISSASLRANSREQLRKTKASYEEMHTSLKRAEQSMEPVLTKFRDNVLYLKHNLNAQAIGSLKGEATSIENEISKLIEDMNKSIQSADTFIKQMP